MTESDLNPPLAFSFLWQPPRMYDAGLMAEAFTGAARSFDAFKKEILSLRHPSRGMRRHIRRTKAATRRKG